MHLKSVSFRPHEYPVDDRYPFNLAAFRQTPALAFDTPITVFVGENGAGKSTLIEALAHKCGIHIWRNEERRRCERNPYEHTLHRHIAVEWSDGPVPGSFFGSSVFEDFVRGLDEWASADPGLLQYFGGKSLVTQSHGQSILSFFRSRYAIRGLYLLDEPETALSPKAQLGLLEILTRMSKAGHAQFILATHSPILLACPGATLYDFGRVPIDTVQYEDTEHYRLYKGFLNDRQHYLSGL